MTIEEKAKAYDEALERARKLKENPMEVFYEYTPKEGDTICDYIFPELKESEDERIRKAIVRFIQMEVEDEIVGNKWLAWLRKQGEQKHALREEDEQHIDSLLKRLDGLCRNEFERTRFAINEDEDWLKSLKQRIGG